MTDIPLERAIGAFTLKNGPRSMIGKVDLNDGELAFCKDTKELWIGVPGGKHMLAVIPRNITFLPHGKIPKAQL